MRPSLKRFLAAVSLAVAVPFALRAAGAWPRSRRPEAPRPATKAPPAVPRASAEARTLYRNLQQLAGHQILFGHQDTLAYGVHWKDTHDWRSDVADVCGKFPAVFGWDMGWLGKTTYNLDRVPFDRMQAWMYRVYEHGGINTISWHMDNLLTGGDSWATGRRVVATILPGGSHHAVLKLQLDELAAFVRGIPSVPGTKAAIPLILRPWHEHMGNWFWWGAPYCSAEEYKALWRFTVDYLREVHGLHNFLYAYSPDRFRSAEQYLERYPGDNYVDILGLDNYTDVGPHGSLQALTRQLRTIVELAEERGKIAALTETGRESIPEKNWWTQRLLPAILTDPTAARIVYVLVWRNDRPEHHYAPYPDHASVADFVAFSQHPRLLFCEDLPRLYEEGLTVV